MSRFVSSTIWLDYREAAGPAKFLPNLSAVAVAGNFLWTASDEMRTIECLAPYEDGYGLQRQFELDALFPGLPGAEAGHEADIEALDVAGGRLWVCGSHSLTRRAEGKAPANGVESEIHKRPSRRLLGALSLGDGGDAVNAPGQALPFHGSGSLRRILGSNPLIAPFMDLPGKENGLDIEGLTVFDGKIYVGLRGPVVDNMAVVATFTIGAEFSADPASLVLNRLDLGELGVRDLTRWKDGILIMAGPVSAANGPFTLFYWKPNANHDIQKPEAVQDFPPSADHPEGLCALKRGNSEGIIVLYDTADPARISGTRYRADWLEIGV